MPTSNHKRSNRKRKDRKEDLPRADLVVGPLLRVEGAAASSKREVLLLGGDLHISVYSVIYDEATGGMIRCITTSPVSNIVSRFYAHLEGTISSRYTYRHEPLPEAKTFCKIEISLSDVSCDVKADGLCDEAFE
ncbi:unnamed protein product [Symbiodinium natans]|uniref:Uncharacterized protein n=1 Tax=Symbiodinium natans TaxID=878477 RepID=A0A812NIP9_9DINO|nr:unnamed protein product [Symbiodinium natans]